MFIYFIYYQPLKNPCYRNRSNSIDINKSNDHFFTQITQHKKDTHMCVGGGELQMFHGRDTNPMKGVSVGCIGHNNF